MEEITGQTGYNSQNLWLHFGLGASSIIDSIRVEWTNGLTHIFVNESVNRNITISESGIIIGLNKISTSIPKDFTLYQNYPNPFNPETKIRFSVANKQIVELKIYDV